MQGSFSGGGQLVNHAHSGTEHTLTDANHSCASLHERTLLQALPNIWLTRGYCIICNVAINLRMWTISYSVQCMSVNYVFNSKKGTKCKANKLWNPLSYCSRKWDVICSNFDPLLYFTLLRKVHPLRCLLYYHPSTTQFWTTCDSHLMLLSDICICICIRICNCISNCVKASHPICLCAKLVEFQRRCPFQISQQSYNILYVSVCCGPAATNLHITFIIWNSPNLAQCPLRIGTGDAIDKPCVLMLAAQYLAHTPLRRGHQSRLPAAGV